MNKQTPEKRDEFRARPLGYELRDDGGEMPTLVGTLAVFNEWAEINSASEGHFLERIDPGAFTKTISESRDSMRVLFQHGKDPTIGDKPLGPIRLLESRAGDVAYEVPLLDTSYNRDIAAMLAADPPVLGSSFRFKVMRESVDRKPKRSAYNPKGLAERTVQEVRMQEFGPVTFPAYASAKAGLRSLTDRMTLGRNAIDPDDLDEIVALMIERGAAYLEQRDDAAMVEVIEKLRSLPALDEGTEIGDGEESPKIDHAPPNDAAQTGTSSGTPRSTSWQIVPSLDALRVPREEKASLWISTT